jgi:hypothetical protein
MLTDAERRTVWTRNGLLATALIDGRVAATWKITRDRTGATLAIDVLKRIGRQDRTALVEEGERLLAFTDPDATTRRVRFAPASRA